MSSELGLDQLSSPESPDFDIVFVHGLFGNRINTWTKNGVLWPQQLLSEDLPKARIFTFGYDADVTKFNLDHEVTKGTMESHAADLCERLAGLRAKTESMVVKSVLGDRTDNFSIISNNIRGIVFLGTPFYGSPVAPWGKAISSMVSVLHKTDTQKVKDLDQKSEKLKILAESFASALHQRIRDTKEIRVAFFHETKKLHGVLVVPEPNSRIPGFGDHASINADHSTMCKFADQDSPGYQSVLAAIKKVSVKEDTGLEDAVRLNPQAKT
ncbi:Protein SERAC1-like protein [Hapsidospora chrysogenum ATCC 11550]|uniref:Protein SERAC1-like protein n=1 Tax=Hapsidospora chrysogenum (strain ATCC 11550 / CBS 779.69 / DSM 880 / IAM 14645 / JCM 23072 / IMI 49137) TaxID=857340 RepID=A0A086TEM1_HAPC1|nr:Protein SERAC1-like protein [Hapsidospora chrysogenum ATCC 11550]